MKNSFCKVNFVYIYDMSGDVERIRNPILTLPIIAYLQDFYGVDFDKISLFSGLHCASFFGIVEIVAGLVEMEGVDINQMDCGGNTPLVWAAGNRHEGVVKTLLGRDGIKPDKPDGDGQTPLRHAAERGHEGVMKILLARGDVDPDKPDELG